MRTQDEVVKYVNNNDDFLGFKLQAAAPFLDFDKARQWLKDDANREDWEADRRPYTRAAVLERMHSYMAFALGKARNHRGISASRSVEKFTVWLYMLGDDELVEYANGRNYGQYGVPILRRICEQYDFEMPEGETWFENMSAGKPCQPGCRAGCGY